MLLLPEPAWPYFPFVVFTLFVSIVIESSFEHLAILPVITYSSDYNTSAPSLTYSECYEERYEHLLPNSIHFPFITFTWSHPWFITYPTLREYLGLLLISTSHAVIVLYIVNSHCLHFHYNTLFFFLSRLSHDHMLHSSYSRNRHLHYCSYCSLLSSSSISISTDHSSINT